MTTEAETLIALKESINKWIQIAYGKLTDRGRNNCALCKLFNEDDCENNCEGCPVVADSRHLFCIGTPYEDWCHHFAWTHKGKVFPYKVVCPTCKELAFKERDFLKSLLPKEQTMRIDKQE